MTPPLSLLVWHLGRRGGGPRYLLELARSLAGRGDVRLAVAISAQSDLAADTASAMAAADVPLLAIDTYRSIPEFATGLLRIPSVRERLRRFVQDHKIEVALCAMTHLWNPMLVGALRDAGALNALVVHDAAPHPGDQDLLRGPMLRLDFRQSERLVCLTDSVADRLRAQGIAPDRIIPSRLGPFRYAGESVIAARRLGPPPHRLLFFGRLLPYKGLDRLIEAMRLLEAESYPATLRLVGQGPLELGALPGNIQLERRWVDETEVPRLFAGTDLVILPYQEASQSGVLPIAHNFAVPSLVTPVGGLLQQVENGARGFVARDGSAAALALAVKTIFEDAPGYAALSAKLADSNADEVWSDIAGSLIRDLRTLRAP